MKTFLIIALILFGSINLSAQINPLEHLFRDKPRDWELYINPTFEYGQIDLVRTKIGGLGGGLIINKKVSFGLVYNSLFKNLLLPAANGGGKLQMRWGGLHLEYTVAPLQIIHLTFPFSAGIGQLKIAGNTNGPITGNPNFYFAEPGFMIESNIWSYAKLGIGTIYRYTRNINYDNITPAELKGFAAMVSLKFGNFRYSHHRKMFR